MNYELAKELKEAGFPRQIHWMCKRADHDCRTERPDCDIRVLSAPTLEELVEACGEEFRELQKFPRFPLGRRAVSSRKYGTHGCQIDGSSAIEAMAKLWLALNKKI